MCESHQLQNHLKEAMVFLMESRNLSSHHPALDQFCILHVLGFRFFIYIVNKHSKLYMSISIHQPIPTLPQPAISNLMYLLMYLINLFMETSLTKGNYKVIWEQSSMGR